MATRNALASLLTVVVLAACGSSSAEPANRTLPVVDAPEEVTVVTPSVSEPAVPSTDVRAPAAPPHVVETTNADALKARFSAALVEAGAPSSAIGAGPITLSDGRVLVVTGSGYDDVTTELTIGSSSEEGVGALTRVVLPVAGEAMIFEPGGADLIFIDESGDDVITAFEVRDIDEDGVLEALITTNINGPQGEDGYSHFEGYFVVDLGESPRLQLAIPELSRRHDSETLSIVEGRFFHVGAGGALERRVCAVEDGQRTCPEEWQRSEIHMDPAAETPMIIPVSSEGTALLAG